MFNLFKKKPKFEYVTELVEGEKFTVIVTTTSNKQYNVSFQDYVNDDYEYSNTIFDYSHKPITKIKNEIKMGYINSLNQILTDDGTYLKTKFIESYKIINSEKIKLERVKIIKV
jgi:hypothetical protein